MSASAFGFRAFAQVRRLAIVWVVAWSLSLTAAEDGPASRAKALFEAGDFQGAIRAYTEALQTAPGNAEWLRERGRAKNRLRDYAAAIGDFEAALQLNPRDVYALTLCGGARSASGDSAGALRDFDRALALAPRNEAALGSRGNLRTDQKDYAGALADFDLALEVNPNNKVTHNNRGNALMRAGRLDEARVAFDRALALDANYTLARVNRGLALEKQGHLAGARSDFEAALKLDPKQAVATRRLADLVKRMDTPDRATPTDSGGGAALISTGPAKTAPTPAEPTPAIPRPTSPPSTAASLVFPPRIDFGRLSGAQYAAAVSAAMEQMRLVLGPRDATETAAFEKSWAAAFDFPCPEVIDYLNRLNPLLARFISLRGAVNYLLGQFREIYGEAMMVAAYDNATAAGALFDQARRYGEQLRGARTDLEKVAAEIEALGNPPDPAALKRRARQQADAALAYVRDAGTPWADLRRCNLVRFRIKGDLAVKEVGNWPSLADPQRMESLAVVSRPHDRTVDTPDTYLARSLSESDFSYVIEWRGNTFYGSVLARKGSEFNESTVCGAVSEDGRRLVDFYLVDRWKGEDTRFKGEQTETEFLWNWPGKGKSRGSSTSEGERCLRLGGDKITYAGRRIIGGGVQLAYTADDTGGSGAKGRAGAAAESVKAFLLAGRIRGSAVDKDGNSHNYAEDERTVEARPHIVEVFFRQVPPEAMPATEYPPSGRTAEETRAVFADASKPWARLPYSDPAKAAAAGKLDRLAALIRGQVASAEADAWKKAAEEAMREEAAKQERVATSRKDIEAIQQHLASLEAQKTAALEKRPCDETLVRELEFRIIGQESEIQAKRDLIASIQTGTLVRTRTPFDQMCFNQVVQQAAADVEQLASADRARRANEALLKQLDDIDRRNLVQKVGKLLDGGGGLDAGQWRVLNQEAYSLVQAKLGESVRQADAEVAAWDNRIWLAETTATAAELSFGLLSGVGEYKVAGILYSLTTSSLNKGLDTFYTTGSGETAFKAALYEGTKSVCTGVNDYVDYAWTAVEAYHANPRASFHDQLQNAVLATGGKWLTSQATSFVAGVITRNVDLDPLKPKPTVQQQFEAAKFRQQMELDQALARDFLDTHKQLRLLQLRSRGQSSPEIDRLVGEVQRKACSVNASYGAKVYIKYQTLPIEQRAFSRVMDDVHCGLLERLNTQMASGRDLRGREIGQWGRFELAPLRNAASAGTSSIDTDFALRQQPDWVPDGAGGLRRNAWLTRDGRPASPREFQETAQEVWNQIYRQATGYSARTSFENITTSQHGESYKDLTWTQLTRERDGRITGADAIDWRWAQQAGDVTRIKHYEMLDQQPLLGHYERRQESCRGTAKDINTKVMTLLDDIRQKRGREMSLADRTHLEEVRTFWGRVQQVLSDFGEGRLPPLEADRQIQILSGGRGLDDLTDRVGIVIESLGSRS